MVFFLVCGGLEFESSMVGSVVALDPMALVVVVVEDDGSDDDSVLDNGAAAGVVGVAAGAGFGGAPKNALISKPDMTLIIVRFGGREFVEEKVKIVKIVPIVEK